MSNTNMNTNIPEWAVAMEQAMAEGNATRAYALLPTDYRVKPGAGSMTVPCGTGEVIRATYKALAAIGLLSEPTIVESEAEVDMSIVFAGLRDSFDCLPDSPATRTLDAILLARVALADLEGTYGQEVHAAALEAHQRQASEVAAGTRETCQSVPELERDLRAQHARDAREGLAGPYVRRAARLLTRDTTLNVAKDTTDVNVKAIVSELTALWGMGSGAEETRSIPLPSGLVTDKHAKSVVNSACWNQKLPFSIHGAFANSYRLEARRAKA